MSKNTCLNGSIFANKYDFTLQYSEAIFVSYVVFLTQIAGWIYPRFRS